MEIEIDIHDHSEHDLFWVLTGKIKVVQLEVEPDRSLDWVRDIICTGLRLGRKESWALLRDGSEIDDYAKTIRQLEIKEGDRFELIRRDSTVS